MPSKPNQIPSVPTNIITGFLGAGKTSTILQLLKNKPKNERWAVLVNEFGEIGIDGALFEGQFSEQQGVYIREVPGGCMCCTGGLPMKVVLTQLLRRSKPDRLLIEPTGLGHPMEVLQTLKDQNFQGVLEIQKIVTLVDARHLSDSRYAEHGTFQQQLSIADVIVGNKQDLYGEHDKEALKAYLQVHSLSDVKLVFAEQGAIEQSLLDGPRSVISDSSHSLLMPFLDDSSENNHGNFSAPIPECGFVKALNKGEGFVSVGWRFSSRFEFDRNKLFALLSGIDAERLKATFITDNGCVAYNLTRDALTEMSFEHFDESRIEIITDELSADWEASLFCCINGGSASNRVTQIDQSELRIF
ncbi:MAG: G3E family GTPase [Gammaproteobacteria bacterium]|jgi:G3E family GTPase